MLTQDDLDRIAKLMQASEARLTKQVENVNVNVELLRKESRQTHDEIIGSWQRVMRYTTSS